MFFSVIILNIQQKRNKMAKDFKTGSYTNDKVGSIKIDKKPKPLELIIEAEMVPPIVRELAEKLEADKMIYGKASVAKSSGVVKMEDNFFDHLQSSSKVKEAASKLTGDYLDKIIENPAILSDKTQKLLDRLNKSNVNVTEYVHAEANALTRTPSKRNKI